ncbi:hypothetical protein ACPOL_3526 [Acidisarcina polymorpha]|uniref:Uncharacterized protein n=1 Tax=Acidisarcina polymorpha TaxID=2211140 RepID=A0A2Z5G0X8_9BACT|nr:hypothetical protein ACPOL_3526 [Acidisarcina polymorpha]
MLPGHQLSRLVGFKRMPNTRVNESLRDDLIATAPSEHLASHEVPQIQDEPKDRVVRTHLYAIGCYSVLAKTFANP